TSAANVFRQRLIAIAPTEISAKAHTVITTFPALFQKLLRILGYQPKYLDSIRRDYLLKKVIAELNAENALTYFNKTADKVGLVKSLGAFIGELWQSVTDAESFAKLSNLKSPKDRDIFLIFRRYQSALDEAGILDVDGAGILALQGLELANER